jgi:hypothetical protein
LYRFLEEVADDLWPAGCELGIEAPDVGLALGAADPGLDPRKVTVIVAGVGDLAFRLGEVFLEIGDPGQAIASVLNQYPADFLEQRGFFVGMDQRMVD